MKKIILSLLILAVMVMPVFAGGGQQGGGASAPSDPNAPVTLNVWCWDPAFNIYAMKEAEKIYKRTRPNVSLNIVETPWNDIQQKFITAFTANQTSTLPDIALVQDNAIQKNIMTYPKGFLPVNGKVDISKFAQFKLNFGSYEGKNYGVPFDNGATATFLRKDIVEQAGLKVDDFNNITWDRFIELGQIVKQKTGVTMLATVGTSPNLIMTILQGAGSWFFKDDGTLYMKDNPALRGSIEVIRDMVNKGVLTMVQDNAAYIASFNSGTHAATINGCWILASINLEKSQSGKWAMANTPRLGNIPGAANFSSQGGSGWVVMANSKVPDAAFDFLDKTWAGSVELFETILESSGAISTWLPAGNSAVYAKPNEFFGGQKIFEDLMAYAAKIPQVKYGVFNYEARDAAARAVTDVIQGKSIDEALDTAQKSVDFLMKQ